MVLSSGHQHHGHDHGHSHGHGVAPPKGHSTAFAFAVALNSAFVVTEVVAGLWSGSVALLADAGHNLGDVLSLLLAWGASVLAARPVSNGFTWGLKSSSILAAIANAALLWVALGMILLETVQRFASPEAVAGKTMIVVAALGIVINGVSAMLFAKGSKSDLNLKAAFQHLLADAAVSAGVVVAGFAILATGMVWIDPLVSLVITLVIGWASWGMLKQSVKMGLLAVPEGIDEWAVRGVLLCQPGVARVHDLHIWGMSTTETALTAHVVMPGGHPGDAWFHALAEELEHRFGIDHATVQIERGEADCHTAMSHA